MESCTSSVPSVDPGDHPENLNSQEDEEYRKNPQFNEGSAANSKEGLNFEVNLQPEKIVEVFKLPDGTQSYRVRWKDTWIHEQLIVSYQHLVDEFWQRFNEEGTAKQVDFALDGDPPAHSTDQDDVKVIVVKSDENKEDSTEKIDDEVDELDFDDSGSQFDDSIDAQEKIENADSNNTEKDEKTSLKRKAAPTKKSIAKKRSKKGTKPIKKKDDEKENQDNKDGDDEDKSNGNADSIVSENGETSETKPKKEKFQYSDEKGPCTCDICGKVISNKYGLREHQSVVHFKNGRFECDVCGKRVTNQRALNMHKTSHSNERKFVCDQCGSSHKTKGNLNYHVKTMHTMIKNFRCDICFKTFKVQAELKEHCFSTHSNAGVITCIVCKKKLTTPLSIYTHSVMHSGAREHECDICGYAFKTLTGLKEHKVTHSENKPIRQCPYCEKKFFSRSQYNAHVMRHTADGTLITYKCPMCEVKFQHKSSYNRHVIRHQPGGDLEFPKENPYLLLDEADLPEGVCHKCRKYYSSKSGFYLHLKKCRDGIVQQFQCPYCERNCSNRSSLKRHIQRRHKGVEFEGQTVQGQEMITKEDENVNQGGIQDGIQYQGAFFDHGYGNQITAVDVSQLPTVDVQLLIDTATAQADGQTHILSNVNQLTQGDENTQNLHILSSHEAAQFAAQLSQAGVIVRSSDVSQDNQERLIVSSAQLDGRTGHIIVSSDGQSGLTDTHQLDSESAAALLQGDNRNGILRDENVLHFNNRAAVIQIQHPTDGITSQQVLAITEQQLQESQVLPSQLQNEHVVNELQQQIVEADNVTVRELQTSQDINVEMDASEHQGVDEQQFIQEEQIVSNLSDNDVEHGYDSMGILKLTQD